MGKNEQVVHFWLMAGGEKTAILIALLARCCQGEFYFRLEWGFEKLLIFLKDS
jgi:hypothetical protein